MKKTFFVVVFVLLGVMVALVGFAPATLADWGLQKATAGRLGLAEPKGPSGPARVGWY